MKSIGEFFAKIQGRQAQKILIYKIVQEAVNKQVNVDLDLAAVSFKAKSVVIKGLSQTAKNQLFIKKPAILKEINSRSAPRIVEDMRFEG